jgi:hypothetical protein
MQLKMVPHACSCTSPTADQLFKLIKSEMKEARRAQEGHAKRKHTDAYQKQEAGQWLREMNTTCGSY